MKHCDKNTKFIHLHATQRMKTNRITQIQNANGAIITDQNQIGTTFSSYFNQLFTSSNPVSIDECLSGFPSRVAEEMNNFLSDTFSEDEIIYALFQMNPLGAFGLDRFFA